MKQNEPVPRRDPESLILSLLAGGRIRLVRDTLQTREWQEQGLGEEELVALVKRLEDQKKIDLVQVPSVVSSFREYLQQFTLSWAFWFMVGVTALTFLLVYVAPAQFPWLAMRWFAGSVFVVFVPGFGLVQLLFVSRRKVDSIERFALSVGLSLALVSLVGLLLNFSPWGIRLDPILLSVSVLVLAFAVASALRDYSRLEKVST
jgi:hypothetical protein